MRFWLFFGLVFTTPAYSGVHNFGTTELQKWKFFGKGSRALTRSNELVLNEDAGSKGVMVVSEKFFVPPSTVTFEAKSSERGVGFSVFFDVSENETGIPLSYPTQYDGAMDYWDNKVPDSQGYVFFIHNPKERKNVSVRRLTGYKLVTAEAFEPKSKTREPGWHKYEIGRNGHDIWMKVDGKYVFKAKDMFFPLPGGALGFRVDGRRDGLASVTLRNIRVKDSRR